MPRAKAEAETSSGTLVLADLVYAGIGGATVVGFAISAIQNFGRNPERFIDDVIGVAVGVIVVAAGIVMATKDLMRLPPQDTTSQNSSRIDNRPLTQ